MEAMNKSTWLIAGAILLGALLIGGMVLFAVNNATFKIATVDANKIIRESELGKKISKELSNKRTEIEGKIESAKTDEEKNKLANEYDQFKANKENEFTEQVKEVISKVAKKKGIKVIASSSLFVYVEQDITDDVIKELDK
ncbi:MAG TPA: hypothetical protein PLC07_04105 [Bacillota bacterium]|nr:hypothetical protein [Bacillota bacterium]HPT86519.1 hypothetical protein [Bacillota bacterium]